MIEKILKDEWYVKHDEYNQSFYIYSDHDTITEISTLHQDNNEAKCKANLIAASPDMYEALKAVEVSLIEDEYYQHFKPLLKTVREAIYKAEGK